MENLLKKVHPDWHWILERSLLQMDEKYLINLENSNGWLPGLDALFAAFRQPLDKIRYILFGESPYPRVESANGLAFWDAKVGPLWSSSGLSKEVNRATSLRNFIKMLLVADDALQDDTSQAAIASLDKSFYCQTATELFSSFISKGFLLLNASLVYSHGQVLIHAKQWRPFIGSLLNELSRSRNFIQIILLGRIASLLPEARFFPCIIAEHPYNLSFISNPIILKFFKPLELLKINAC